MCFGKFLVAMLLTLGEGHTPNETVKILPCSHEKRGFEISR